MGDRRFFGGIIESGGQGRHRITQNSAFCVMLTKIVVLFVVLKRRSGTSFWCVVQSFECVVLNDAHNNAVYMDIANSPKTPRLQ